MRQSLFLEIITSYTFHLHFAVFSNSVKELTFDLKDWEMIERRAEACHTDTTKYLRTMILEKQPIFYDFSELAPMINGMRIISGNINQIAKKVNATNNIYAEDVIVLRKEVTELSRTVNLSLSALMSKRV